MKALLLIEDDEKALEVEGRIRLLGYDAVRYRNPLKALDNLEEVAPHAIIASALDFPRHWKIIADVVRSARSRQDCLIILLRGERFDPDEAAKAGCLEVNAVFSETLAEGPELDKFIRLLRRYARSSGAKEKRPATAPAWGDLLFLFSHPRTTRILGGSIVTMTAGGMSLALSEPSLVSDLDEGAILEEAHLKMGTKLLTLRCKVLRAGDPLGLGFLDLAAPDKAYIAGHLAKTTPKNIFA
jgi:hypothetical protein